MHREFIYTKLFQDAWNALSLSEEALRRLELHLLVTPDDGDVIENTGGLRKLRWTLPGRGKSNGIRVLYADFKTYGLILMVIAYPKSKKENITDYEKVVMKQLITEFKRRIQGG